MHFQRLLHLLDLLSKELSQAKVLYSFGAHLGDELVLERLQIQSVGVGHPGHCFTSFARYDRPYGWVRHMHPTLFGRPLDRVGLDLLQRVCATPDLWEKMTEGTKKDQRNQKKMGKRTQQDNNDEKATKKMWLRRPRDGPESCPTDRQTATMRERQERWWLHRTDREKKPTVTVTPRTLGSLALNFLNFSMYGSSISL